MSYSPGKGPYNNPQITISTPLQPPPQQLTTIDGTIQGAIDGVNQLFVWQVWFPLVNVFRNGNLQTQGTDYGSGPTALVFYQNSIPQPGDILTIEGYGTI
jgi:hypothetical protein